MSSFSGLGTALSALQAQRAALDTAGQNVANANTEGYSRQRVRFDALGGPTQPSMFSGGLKAGSGVRVGDIERLRDAFLEARFLRETASESYLRRTQGVLSRVELSFAEPGERGVQAQLAKMWSAWDDLANRPSDPGARSQLLEQSHTVASAFNQIATELGSLRQSVVDRLPALVEEVNVAAAQVAELNLGIQRATNAGLNANALADQRDRLVEQLARSAGVTVRGGESGSADLYLDGTALVKGGAVEGLGVATDAAGTVSIVWARLGLTAGGAGGDAAALLDSANRILPAYQAQIDAVAAHLAGLVNAQHQKGQDSAGNPGGAFFTGTTAATLAVNPAVAADPGLIAAAAAGAGALDGSNAQILATFGASWVPDPTSGASPPPLVTSADARYRDLIAGLGVEARRAVNRLENQQQLTSQVDGARKAESSVDLDEEMTNMVAFQHAYAAAAKFMTAVDQALETLMRTGLVGR